MALIEDALKGNAATGVAAGIGAALLLPVAMPALSWVLRPVAKLAVQTGVELYRGALAPLGAAVSALVAAAEAELHPPAARRDEPEPASAGRRGGRAMRGERPAGHGAPEREPGRRRTSRAGATKGKR